MVSRFDEGDIKRMRDLVNSLDTSWEVHLDATVIVDGMRLNVTFDKPAVNAFKEIK